MKRLVKNCNIKHSQSQNCYDDMLSDGRCRCGVHAASIVVPARQILNAIFNYCFFVKARKWRQMNFGKMRDTSTH